MRGRKPVFFILVAIIAVLGYIAAYGLEFSIGDKDYSFKGANKMRYGIDIRGGIEAIYEPKDAQEKPTEEQLEAARAIIETRLDFQNITDREITVDVDNSMIIVRFPWQSEEIDFDPQAAIAELGETALLTFRDPEGNVVLKGDMIVKSQSDFNQQNNSYYIDLEFNEEGKELFKEATTRLVNQNIGIYMDEDMISNPVVETAITEGRAQITGRFTADEAKALANKISSGSLPFSLKTENNSSISPTLGKSALDITVKAAILAFILVCLFMIFYYRLPGFVAVFALCLQLIGQLLALSLPQFTLTLPGIAAVILSIGMGVDANIISSERIKEEIRDGKSVGASVEAGFHKAFSAVFDGNITVMIVAVIIWYLGSGTMKSFGYSLLTGVILNFLAGVTVSRMMIKSLIQFKWLRKPELYGARRVAK
ncbi:MAG: preprotein translocase subunit SecD [Firmicutes bacterium ADurb.Bin193]|nr:MAG: preprotein translocase subunit SecD [Firmicutes bacterium ADurb.Bin193]